MYFRKIFLIIGILFAFSAANSGMLYAAGYAYYPGGHMMGTGYMGWMMLLFWGLLLIMLILIVRWVLRLSQPKRDSRTALDILQKRLASGEIDIKEFKERKELL